MSEDIARSVERAAALLDAHSNYRVTRALPPLDRLPLPKPEGRSRVALVIDTETTSLDVGTGRIIQIAACPVRFDRRARIVEIGRTRSWLEDPGSLLSEEIVQLTGLNNGDLAGQQIDDAAVERLLTSADVLIAHNAGFDRPWWEARFPLARAKPWACSLREVDWRWHGQESRSLGVLLDRVGGWFNSRHRADADVDALVALLTAALPSGWTVCTELILTAQRPTIRLDAIAAPFAAKDALRTRGYRWMAEKRVWQREVPEESEPAELAWLAAEASCPNPVSHRVTWFERHR
jgi:DNA polymerase-3 subunit epsilon